MRFTVGRLGEVQALYALDTSARRSRLAGAMLYARTAEDRVVWLHIGLSPEYSSRRPRSDALLALKLIEQLKKSCGAIKGVETIEILYGSAPPSSASLAARPRAGERARRSLRARRAALP